MEITKRREIFLLSELRAIACIAIVILHTFYAASVSMPPVFTHRIILQELPL